MYYFIGVLVCILYIFGMWKVFEKANNPGYLCLIPIYNVYKFFEITTGNGWDMLYCLIPVFGQIYYIYVRCAKLSQVFGHGVGYTIGLFFLPVIFIIIIGIGSSEYNGLSDMEPTESIASLYLIGGLFALLIVIPTLFNTSSWGIGLLLATIGSPGLLFLIIGFSGLSVVRSNTAKNMHIYR